ncbi:outer membrane protein [Thalassospira sp.]|uniref:outer membrane protein n=1 Tax=Thalassospira sp. TaxID=1912094 RepID=UPI002733201D|nr:outer membrane beta-barrel protein [Thalassospira sp.]MDP2698760.1 outer membrane beta-barrel protein [Thalassospira sp.]
MGGFYKKYGLVAAGILAGLTVSISASAEPVSSHNWQGLYGGLALGGAYGKASPDSTITAGNPSYIVPGNIPLVNNALQKDIDGTDLTGSALFGYNVQKDSMVYGIEADLTVMDFSESTQHRANYTNPVNSFRVDNELETKFTFSIRPKIGYSFGDAMVHIAAGPAISRFKYNSRFSDTTGNNPNASFSDTKTALGVSSNIGVNYAFAEGWSLRGDYVFNYFPNAVDATSTLVATGAANNNPINHETDFISHNIRFGLIKQF